MATYFWAMVRTPGRGRVPGEVGEAAACSDLASQGQEGVAAALAACKTLKEMSHLEPGAEVGRTLREAKHEQLALGRQPRSGGCRDPVHLGATGRPLKS